MIKKSLLLSALVSLLFTHACTTQQHLSSVRDPSGDRISVGKVQRTIRLGMPSAQVIETLGSPNIISTDEHRREVWVYDKISTETVYSTSNVGGGIGALILGGNVGTGLGFNGGNQSGAKATTQRTLTIIVKFNNEGTIRDIAYHSSQF